MGLILCGSQALDIGTIRKIDRLRLIAESHDQGHADITSAGNWTWFELAILQDESAYQPRVKDGVALVWKSHDNRFLEDDFGWVRSFNLKWATRSCPKRG